jgi:hypothetical protein
VPELDDPSTVYLFDPAGHGTGETREPYRCRAFTIVASSPNPSHYKDFLKHGGEKLVMAPWALEELVAVAPFVRGTPSAEVVERRFLRHGGISRAVLSDKPLFWESQLKEAIAACELEAVERSVGLSDTVQGATHKVLLYDVLDDDCTEARARFASDSVARDFSQVLLRHRRSKMLDFLRDAVGRPELAKLCGDMFEYWMHSTLPRGGRFRVRRLNGTAPGGCDPGELVLPALDQVDVGAVKDLPRAASGDADVYYHPTVTNFPVVDALVRCNTPFSGTIGLQATVSLKHPLKAARVERILEQLGITESDRFDLFFVVWPASFEDFKEQVYHTDKGGVMKELPAVVSGAVTQWVLELPIVDSVASPRRRALDIDLASRDAFVAGLVAGGVTEERARRAAADVFGVPE